jgi:hypothetical protein
LNYLSSRGCILSFLLYLRLHVVYRVGLRLLGALGRGP